MNKKEVYNYLKEKEIWFEAFEHKAVFNMSEASEIEVPYPESEAKNLFVCDDKKMNFYLIIVKGDKRVNLKDFRKKNSFKTSKFCIRKISYGYFGIDSRSSNSFGNFE